MNVFSHSASFRLSVVYIVPAVLLLLTLGSTGSFADAGSKPLRYNQSTINAIDREIAKTRGNDRYRAVLRGLRWCVVFCDDDENFNFTFSNYVTMLDELTLHNPRPELRRIVHELILNEFRRAFPRFSALFTADGNGYEDLISILPVAYHHGVPLAPIRKFVAGRFAAVAMPDHLEEFRKAARELDYDHLTDLVVGATFVNMAYRWGVDKDFRLPPDHYRTIMKECASIPFIHRFKFGKFHDQNYFATHVLLALDHYGQKPLAPSVTADKVFFYLAEQYETVRGKVGDLDLLCEYLYCFRQFAPAGVAFISEGERYVMSLQQADGSWALDDDVEGDPYDLLHPTWTAITLLAQGT